VSEGKSSDSKRLTVIDPNNVREIFLTGGTNIQTYGPNILINGFIARPNIEAVLNGEDQPWDYVVACRLVVEPEKARGLAENILTILDRARQIIEPTGTSGVAN
jgi:hypothetical protein